MAVRLLNNLAKSETKSDVLRELVVPRGKKVQITSIGVDLCNIGGGGT